jgi:AcrR family transcriptional regulator
MSSRSPEATVAVETATPHTPQDIPRRHAAGTDPAKRNRILDGAVAVFMEKGFEAASVNDIRHAAGVSKGTLYVYFDNKEDMFIAMIEREREKLFSGIEEILTGDLPPRRKLGEFGRALAEILCSDKVIRAQRIVIGTLDTLPELGLRFYEKGALRAHHAVMEYFAQATEAGHFTVNDPDLAAAQFVELSTLGLWRQRLFGALQSPPTDAEIARHVDGAIAMIMARYGSGDAGPTTAKHLPTRHS